MANTIARLMTTPKVTHMLSRMPSARHPAADGHAVHHGLLTHLDARVDDVEVVVPDDPAAAIAKLGSRPGHLPGSASHGRRPVAELALGSVSAQVIAHRTAGAVAADSATDPAILSGQPSVTPAVGDRGVLRVLRVYEGTL
ncbi:MAG TPA: hypothetical protein VK611_28125 [Acidimicrobiales bacterium]|nr:hypothetical protein [Acidimicrobiales bacterium]